MSPIDARLTRLARSVGAFYNPETQEFSILDLESGVDYDTVLTILMNAATRVRANAGKCESKPEAA